MESQYITIESYPKVWKIEKMIYSAGNLTLPRPVAPRHVAYYLLIMIIMYILPFGWLPWVLRYIVIPLGISQFLLRAKLDGKAPQWYFISLVGYLTHKPMYCAAFSYYARRPGVLRLRWYCRRGDLIEKEAL